MSMLKEKLCLDPWLDTDYGGQDSQRQVKWRKIPFSEIDNHKELVSLWEGKRREEIEERAVERFVVQYKKTGKLSLVR